MLNVQKDEVVQEFVFDPLILVLSTLQALVQL